ncbi:MAG TPA: WalW protein, partial [Dehalococcoidia bacterium]|nr:WalW protein [Dehalococcoidia bacterium]
MSSICSAREIKYLFGDIEFVAFSKQKRPILTVVIDTEEEFDWNFPQSRKETSVTAMSDIGLVQDIFDDFNVRPCYMMDYPVATQKQGFLPLKEIFDSGRCALGAHLHPWVSPPHVEQVTKVNTFPGNLPAELERDKLDILKGIIESNFQCKVLSYKAGRYGFGVNTAALLESLGFEIDLSPSPGFNQSDEGGPDFTRFTNRAFWFGSR